MKIGYPELRRVPAVGKGSSVKILSVSGELAPSRGVQHPGDGMRQGHVPGIWEDLAGSG